jgi:hypothetical protein
MARVWADSQHSGTALLMLLAIADFADDEGNAYPAVSTLARKCRMKPRNATYLLRELQQSGELQVRLNEGPRGCNRYRIVLTALGVQQGAGVQSGAGVQGSAAAPAIHGRLPLQPSADEPSLNHQEPLKRERARKARTARNTLIPENWEPSEALKAWASQSRPDLDLIAVSENFRDHYIANGESRASWDALFRKWVRRERAGGNAQEQLEASNRGVAARFLAGETAYQQSQRERVNEFAPGVARRPSAFELPIVAADGGAALEKIKRDRQLAVPPSAEVRAQLDRLSGRPTEGST